jgi:predicted enzyme related to lactoylglutathione lyase
LAFEGLSKIGQIHLSVADVDRSVAFYRDVLGIPFLFAVPGQQMAFFECDGVRLYIGVPESEEFRSRSTIYFSVEDIDAAYAELRERGVSFRGAPHLINQTESSELWMVFFTDPDGNNLALMAEWPTSQVVG